MINDEFKVIFIHIPRTSGTSIESAFDKNMDHIGGKHLNASSIKKIAGNDKWDCYFKFSIVRNPWERFASMYNMPFFKKINKLSGKNIEYFYENYYLPIHESCVTCSEYLDTEDIDLIGKYEERNEFIINLKKVINNISISEKLDHHWQRKTKNQKKKWFEYLNLKTFDLITKKYEDDVARFNYNPDKFRNLIKMHQKKVLWFF